MPGYVLIYDPRRWVRSDSTDVTIVLPIAAGGTGNTTGTATVNANLTGPITSVGNATSVASQTGAGSRFVMSNGPTLDSPIFVGGSIPVPNGLQFQARNAANTFVYQMIGNSNDVITLGDASGSIGNEIRLSSKGATTATADVSGNFAVGTAALATNATNGFLYIPTCAGVPTGVPTAKTGLVPMVYDSTNDNFYIYRGGWKKVTLA